MVIRPVSSVYFSCWSFREGGRPCVIVGNAEAWELEDLGWVLTRSLIVSLWAGLSTSLGFSRPIIILRGPDRKALSVSFALIFSDSVCKLSVGFFPLYWTPLLLPVVLKSVSLRELCGT